MQGNPVGSGAPQQGAKLTITPQSLQSKMKLSPQLAQQLQRIVVAGMKVMFSPQTQNLVAQALQGNGPIGVRVGTAIAGLMGLLQKESNNSLPPQLLIPAAILLVAHAAEFIDKSGMGMGDKDVAQAIDVVQHIILAKGGINSDKLASVDPQQVKAGAARGPAPGGAPQPQAPQQSAPPVQAGGLIGRGMQ